MTRINLILPAAGLGFRFQEVGELRPKPLIPVFDIPMIMWVLLNFQLLPMDKIWIISQAKDRIPEVINNFTSILPFEVNFLEIDNLTEGPASTVNLILKDLPNDEGLIVANTDQYVFADLNGFIKSVRSKSRDGHILTMNATSNAWSYVRRNNFGKITEVIEKVEVSNEATVGVYGWSNTYIAKCAFGDLFQNNIRTKNEFYVAPTYNYLIKRDFSIETFLVGKHGLDVHGLGTPKDLDSFMKIPQAEFIAKKYKAKLGMS